MHVTRFTSFTTFTSPDIECDGCANAIKNAVGKLEGVTGVQVDIKSKQVTVKHDSTIAPGALASALDKAGFPTSE